MSYCAVPKHQNFGESWESPSGIALCSTFISRTRHSTAKRKSTRRPRLLPRARYTPRRIRTARRRRTTSPRRSIGRSSKHMCLLQSTPPWYAGLLLLLGLGLIRCGELVYWYGLLSDAENWCASMVCYPMRRTGARVWSALMCLHALLLCSLLVAPSPALERPAHRLMTDSVEENHTYTIHHCDCWTPLHIATQGGGIYLLATEGCRYYRHKACTPTRGRRLQRLDSTCTCL